MRSAIRSAAARGAALCAVLLIPLLARPAGAQAAPDVQWSPPSRQMPAMPRLSELRGDWLGPRVQWFRGLDRVAELPRERVSGLRPEGEAHDDGEHLQFVRFSDGPIPVAVWSDRNGDRRADLIELYRRGGLIVQLIDADFDGNANVLRFYDMAGTLLREERL